MAMLAEPRRRKKYNLQPRGKPLYEDENHFGRKILEKMGWSKGKGLGAKEDGSKDFVKVNLKNDNRGFGFEDRNDQWTQHEENFSGLLKSLNCKQNDNEDDDSERDAPAFGLGFKNLKNNQEVETTNTSACEDKLKQNISGVSLEQISKQSKVRVHYKKFTKSKDISQYSEKDLANIFGKKATIQEDKSIINNGGERKTESSPDENFGGVQTINTGLLINDYFKMKMESFKQKNKSQSSITSLSEENNINKGEKASDKDDTKQIETGKLNENDSYQHALNVSGKKRNNIKNKQNETNNDSDPNQRSIGIDEPRLSEEVTNKKETRARTKCNEGNEISKKTALEGVYKKKKKKRNHSNEYNGIIDLTECDNLKMNLVKLSTTTELLDNKNDDEERKLYRKQNGTNDLERLDEFKEEKPLKKRKKKKQSNEVDYLRTKSPTSETKREICPEDVHPPSGCSHKPDAPDSSSLTDLKTKYDSFNNYTISSFCAEKFRNIDIVQFPGSSLLKIDGYALSNDTQLNVETIENDAERITNLWKCILDKYEGLEKPKKTYESYIKEARKARKHKLKKPKLHVKSWKRKNAFSAL